MDWVQFLTESLNTFSLDDGLNKWHLTSWINKVNQFDLGRDLASSLTLSHTTQGSSFSDDNTAMDGYSLKCHLPDMDIEE